LRSLFSSRGRQTRLANAEASRLFSRGDNFKAGVSIYGSRCGAREMTLHGSVARITAVVVIVVIVVVVNVVVYVVVENVRGGASTSTMRISESLRIRGRQDIRGGVGARLIAGKFHGRGDSVGHTPSRRWESHARWYSQTGRRGRWGGTGEIWFSIRLLVAPSSMSKSPREGR
jgi:hypothetical protein